MPSGYGLTVAKHRTIEADALVSKPVKRRVPTAAPTVKDAKLPSQLPSDRVLSMTDTDCFLTARGVFGTILMVASQLQQVSCILNQIGIPLHVLFVRILLAQMSIHISTSLDNTRKVQVPKFKEFF
jgi:hypothetical protein